MLFSIYLVVFIFPEQDFPVAIVVPDEPAFVKWAHENGFKGLSYKELCENKVYIFSFKSNFM